MDAEMCTMNKDSSKNANQKEILGLNIENLGLSTRACNALKRAGLIDDKGFITPRFDEEVRGARNLGRKSMEDVVKKLEELGYKATP